MKGKDSAQGSSLDYPTDRKKKEITAITDGHYADQGSREVQGDAEETNGSGGVQRG